MKLEPTSAIPAARPPIARAQGVPPPDGSPGGGTFKRYGAMPEEWGQFADDLCGYGLYADLLPVVSDPTIPISEHSKLAAAGKTPSIVNRAGKIAGLPKWTEKRSTPVEVDRWSQDARLGACLQTRHARAIDIDIGEETIASAVEQFAADFFGFALPCRWRENSAKRLLLLLVKGEIAKSVVRTRHGAIEMLGNGQQCVVAGTHPTGERYRWRGLGPSLPEVSAERYAEFAQVLAERFGVEVESGNLRKRDADIDLPDTVADLIRDLGLSLGEGRGMVFVDCPKKTMHSCDNGESQTAWLVAGSNGHTSGRFHCFHASCGVTQDEFLEHIGWDGRAEFADLVEPEGDAAHNTRFRAVPAGEFTQGQPPRWLVKRVLPQAALGVIYGSSGAGKSFFALDLVAAVALGQSWREFKVRQTNVLYVCAEGAGGFRSRVKAYCHERAIDFGDALQVIAGQPNFLGHDDPASIVDEARRTGAGVVVIDTLAQVTPGGDENSSVDMGKALGQCQRIHEATGALVILIHHAGKDAARGARGWSGLRAACDVEIEVSAQAIARVAKVTKMKDGEEGAEFGFKLVPVAVGIDEDGEPIESCVVREVDAQSAPPPRGVAGIVWSAFNELVALGDQDVPVDALLAAAIELLPEPDDGAKDRRRDNARRALKSLCDEGRLFLEAGKVGFYDRSSTENLD